MKYFFLITFVCLSSSCVTSIKLHKENTDLPTAVLPGKKWEQNAPSFLLGFISGPKIIKVWEKCPKDWHTIKIYRSFPHTLVSFLTLGIYIPMKVVIVCGNLSNKKPGFGFEQFDPKSDTEDLLKEWGFKEEKN